MLGANTADANRMISQDQLRALASGEDGPTGTRLCMFHGEYSMSWYDNTRRQDEARAECEAKGNPMFDEAGNMIGGAYIQEPEDGKAVHLSNPMLGAACVRTTDLSELPPGSVRPQ